MLWCLANAIEIQNNYGDIKLSKKHKDDTERIDPVAATMNALARALVHRNTNDLSAAIGAGNLRFDFLRPCPGAYRYPHGIPPFLVPGPGAKPPGVRERAGGKEKKSCPGLGQLGAGPRLSGQLVDDVLVEGYPIQLGVLAEFLVQGFWDPNVELPAEVQGGLDLFQGERCPSLMSAASLRSARSSSLGSSSGTVASLARKSSLFIVFLLFLWT